MEQATNPSPYGQQNIIPYIMVADVAKLIAFTSAAFGAELRFKLDRNDGSVMHAEVQIGANIIMMGEPTPQFGAMPVSIYLYVMDCDAVYTKALAAGGVSMAEIATMHHAGQRYGCVKDFAGNLWWIATHLENVSVEEAEQRIKAMPGTS